MSDIVSEIGRTLNRLHDETEELRRFMRNMCATAWNQATWSSQQIESIRLVLRRGADIRDEIESLRQDALEFFL
jgi:hypothetical protein